MRTTITIDHDVATEIEKMLRTKKIRFKHLINEALRLGLRQLSAPQRQRRVTNYQTPAVSLGRPLLPSLDNVAEILAVAEEENYK